jgi:hypothetical protein
MKIKLFGITADTIPDLISNIILFFVERNLSKLSLTRNDIMKFYYEIKLYMDNHDIFSIIDEESFLRFIKSVLDSTEEIFEEQKKNDPKYVDKLLKKYAGMWKVYALVNDFFDANDIATLMNSEMSKSVQRSINKKMIEDDDLLDYKVMRDVDEAIKVYDKLEPVERDTFVEKAIFTEKNDSSSLLGGEMRIRSPWVKE